MTDQINSKKKNTKTRDVILHYAGNSALLVAGGIGLAASGPVAVGLGVVAMCAGIGGGVNTTQQALNGKDEFQHS